MQWFSLQALNTASHKYSLISYLVAIQANIPNNYPKKCPKLTKKKLTENQRNSQKYSRKTKITHKLWESTVITTLKIKSLKDKRQEHKNVFFLEIWRFAAIKARNVQKSNLMQSTGKLRLL